MCYFIWICHEQTAYYFADFNTVICLSSSASLHQASASFVVQDYWWQLWTFIRLHFLLFISLLFGSKGCLACCTCWSYASNCYNFTHLHKFRVFAFSLTSLWPFLNSLTSPGFQTKVFTACVQSTMLHGSETWAPNASDLQRLRRNDCAMIRWICGAKLEDEISSAVLHQKLDLDEITAVVRTRRLRWYGHVQRATSCISSITRLGLPGTRDRGRPRKTWSARVRNEWLYTTWMVSTR